MSSAFTLGATGAACADSVSKPACRFCAKNLAQRHAGTQAHDVTGNTAATFGKFWNGLRSLVLQEFTHAIANHAHAHADL